MTTGRINQVCTYHTLHTERCSIWKGDTQRASCSKERPSTAVENDDASASGLPFQQTRQDRSHLLIERGKNVQNLPEERAKLLQNFNALNAPQGVLIHKFKLANLERYIHYPNIHCKPPTQGVKVQREYQRVQSRYRWTRGSKFEENPVNPRKGEHTNWEDPPPIYMGLTCWGMSLFYHQRQKSLFDQ